MSSDRKQNETGERAPRLAAAMEDVRAASARQGQGHERAQLGRLGGGRRVVAEGGESAEDDGRRRT